MDGRVLMSGHGLGCPVLAALPAPAPSLASALGLRGFMRWIKRHRLSTRDSCKEEWGSAGVRDPRWCSNLVFVGVKSGGAAGRRGWWAGRCERRTGNSASFSIRSARKLGMFSLREAMSITNSAVWTRGQREENGQGFLAMGVALHLSARIVGSREWTLDIRTPPCATSSTRRESVRERERRCAPLHS